MITSSRRSAVGSGSAMDFQEADDRVSYLTGRIVRSWTAIDQWVIGEIRLIQGINRMRHLRVTVASGVEEIRDKFFAPPGDEVGVRFRHLGKLIRTIDPSSDATIERLRLLEEARSFYSLRNDLAHASSTVMLSAKGPRLILENPDWVEKVRKEIPRIDKAILNPTERDFRREREQFESWADKNWSLTAGIKRMEIADLEKSAIRLQELLLELRASSINVPIEGAPFEPNETPPRRGNGSRLSK